MSRTRGVVASLAGLAVIGGVVSGCGAGEVEIEAPPLSGEDASACRELVDHLPDTLLGGLRRPVEPEGAPGAAWGDDPPVVLTCGVDVPTGYDQFSACTEVGRVGWFVPPGQLEDLGGGVVATVLTHSPRVELEIPAPYRTAGVDGALTELAPVVRRHLSPTEPCH